jgi:hypothetical protein
MMPERQKLMKAEVTDDARVTEIDEERGLVTLVMPAGPN